ncbi:MAG: homoserine O-acetyltransferase [Rikenellaceae bacterium]
MEIFRSEADFCLECGEVLKGVTIAYTSYGAISPSRDNIIWVCHALTASSEVAEWWPHTVEKGRFLDPDKYFVICANILGSPYGSTSPLSINAATGEPYYDTFPLVTVRDMVAAHKLLASHLNIKRVKMLIGSSLGGFQALEWIVSEPDFAETAVLIATSAKAEPWAIAFSESQRMALLTDPTFGEKNCSAGAHGLATARSIAMLSYRGQRAYDHSQEEDVSKIDDFRAASYQRYQGEKLVKRFNAYSYYSLTKSHDSHDVGRDRGGLSDALSRVKARCTIISVSSDILFPSCGHMVLYNRIKNSKMYVIDSNFGHDGFLVESDKLNLIIKKHLVEVV